MFAAAAQAIKALKHPFEPRHGLKHDKSGPLGLPQNATTSMLEMCGQNTIFDKSSPEQSPRRFSSLSQTVQGWVNHEPLFKDTVRRSKTSTHCAVDQQKKLSIAAGLCSHTVQRCTERGTGKNVRFSYCLAGL